MQSGTPAAAFPLTGGIELLHILWTFCHEAIKGLLECKFQWLRTLRWFRRNIFFFHFIMIVIIVIPY